MWYYSFMFEIKYRLRRPETYLFFLFLLLFSLVGVDFVFQGVELGLVKKNAPLVLAKTMAAITGLSMIIVSMVMGVPILRDVKYDIFSLVYATPLSKRSYLLGRFLGSFVVLLFIFSAMLPGMMAATFMPWANQEEYLPFQFIHYLQPFLWVVLPILFFGASVFFVTGALSKSWMLVYTQGVIIFLLFIISKSIPNETAQAILDPFSLSALTETTNNWTVADRNSFLLPLAGSLLYNKLCWIAVGIIVMLIGYYRFKMTLVPDKPGRNKQQPIIPVSTNRLTKSLPTVRTVFHRKARLTQLFLNTWFHSIAILKLSSFWAIVCCSFIVLLVNSVSLGTSFGVDSYPTTYLIIEELREMSLYFFLILLTFFSGEISWKERDAKMDQIHDALPLDSFVNIGSRLLALLLIYSIIILSLIVAGMLFQTLNGYYRYEVDIYFFGFFLELFPFLALYTLAALFFQAVTGNKFIGMLATISFIVINIAISKFGIEHVLVNFAGQTLPAYSDMNGYGHFLAPYFLVKIYWLSFGVLLLIVAGNLLAGNKRIGKPGKISLVCLILFIGTGSTIFYHTNILNEYWTKSEQAAFRAEYEKTLKKFETIPQPKIIHVNLKIDLFPSRRAYAITGNFMLTNTAEDPIQEIHLQKQIASNLELKELVFDRRVSVNTTYEKFHYTIYKLEQSLAPGDTLNMSFKQTLEPQGFATDHTVSDVVNNGTFFDNGVLPGFGYLRKYELQEEEDRKEWKLPPPTGKAGREDEWELLQARGGTDSKGTTLDIIISTDAPQTALSSGDLIQQWNIDDRNYFHYKTNQLIIPFYPVVSARYELVQDRFIPAGSLTGEPIELEIYYQSGHEYNLSRMMESMKMSLNYYSTQFSPYPYRQLRIVEFPRYRSFAQSLPGIIPFSEAIGFVMNIDDKKDLDMPFFITAHEVAHQWWGIQVEAANVLGQKMILETLAQYAAMMVFKEKYGEEKLQQFLKFQSDTYQEAKLKSKKLEPPLALVDKEEHIYYNKGALAMYELQQRIGEKNLNKALQNFLQHWRSFNNPAKPKRYSTTADLLHYFRQAAPDSAQHLITDLFEREN